MTHTGSCTTVASRAIHLFGLGDGHSFTTRQRTQTGTHARTHGHAHTDVSTPGAARTGLVAQAWPQPIGGWAQGGLGSPCFLRGWV